MRVPNSENALVDIRKLRDYCLNPDHPVGKHKARTFASALGLTADDAEILKTRLLEAVQTSDAEIGKLDEYGQRYTVDFEFEWSGKQLEIRSGWIIKSDRTTPELTTCFPL